MPGLRDLDQCYLAVCERGGLLPDEVDVSALEGMTMRGMGWSQGDARQALDLLNATYAIDMVDAEVLRFVPRGGGTVATIDYDRMGASVGSSEGEPLRIMRANDLEVAAQVVVKYSNADDDYQDGSESSHRVSNGIGVDVRELAIVLTPTEARRVADRRVMEVAAGMLSYGPINVSRDYVELEPTDPVTLIDHDGREVRARVSKCTISGGLMTMEFMADDAEVLESVVETSDDYAVTVPIERAPTVTVLMDIPILRDLDDGPGFYVAMRGDIAAPSPTIVWPGGALFRSLDGVVYSLDQNVTSSAVMGVATNTLADWVGGNVFDETNALTVDVDAGELYGDTRDNLLTLGANALLVGSEIIQFRDATLTAPGEYRLTGLLRGRRGTEWAQTGHASGEAVVLLRMAGLRRVQLQLSELDALRYYKGVTLGRNLSTADPLTLTATGVGLKPWAPVDVRAARNTSGDVAFTWSRRTRLATNFTNGTVPLGEAAEAYVLEVYDDSGYGTVLRTITSLTDAEADYPAADQVTDFGSAQATLYVRVYQVSATVGRGYPGQAAV